MKKLSVKTGQTGIVPPMIIEVNGAEYIAPPLTIERVEEVERLSKAALDNPRLNYDMIGFVYGVDLDELKTIDMREINMIADATITAIIAPFADMEPEKKSTSEDSKNPPPT